MAKIRQLSGTQQYQPSQVYSPTIDATPVAQGLADVAVAYQGAQASRDNAGLQLYRAQGENASWELDDWRNNFLRNMNNPENLKSYFSGTPFEDVVSGIETSTQLTDSTYAQSLYIKAVETSGARIEDEAYRNQWITSRMREWEQYEAPYTAQADSVLQGEALKSETQNLNAIWKSGGGTVTPEFRGKLDEIYGMGLIDIAQGDALLLNYQKAEQQTVIEAQLWQKLMPLDEDGNVVAKFIKTEEQMKIIANGMDLSLDGVAYMSDDEVQSVVTRMISKANNYTVLHEGYIEEGRDEMYANYWQAVQGIISSDAVTAPDKTALMQQLADEVIGLYGTEMPQYHTGQPDIPIVSRGMHDTDKLNTLMGKMNSYVSAGGVEGSTPTGLVQANNIMIDGTLSPDRQLNALTYLYENQEISSSDYKSFGNRAVSEQGSMYDRVRARVVNTSIEEEWDADIRGALSAQIGDFYSTSGGLTVDQVETGAFNIIENFYKDNSRISTFLDDWDGTGNLWNEVYRRGGSYITSDARKFLKDIEAGNYAGTVHANPEKFSELAKAQALNFMNNFQSGSVEYFGPELQLLENGEPLVVGALVDPFGVPTIAVPMTSQEGAERGTVEVKVFQAVLSGASDRRIKYVEVTEHPNYFVATYDSAGDQVSPYLEDGSYNYSGARGIFAGDGRKLSVGSDYSTLLQSITIDPTFMAGMGAFIPTEKNTDYEPTVDNNEPERITGYERMMGQ